MGNNSFEDVFDNLLKVKDENIPSSIICVVNKTTEKYYLQILDFFKKYKINVTFNPQFPSGRAAENPDLGLSPEEFGALMIKLFDHWFYDETNPVIDIKPFSEIIGNLFEYKNRQQKKIIPFDCTFRNNCANSFLTVDPVGNVYTCGRFAGNPHFCMGNINSNSIEEMLKQKPVENIPRKKYTSSSRLCRLQLFDHLQFRLPRICLRLHRGCAGKRWILPGV